MTTTETKRTAVVLTSDEEHAIFKYCIENHLIVEDKTTIFGYSYRMLKKAIVENINKLDITGGKKINEYHIGASIQRTSEWVRRLDKPFELKETAEVEQIRIQHKKDQNEIAALRAEVEALKKPRAVTIDNSEILNLHEKLRKINYEMAVEKSKSATNKSKLDSIAEILRIGL